MEPRVLIVEDNRVVNDSLADGLGGRGYTCLQAFDGQEAIGFCEEFAPDALVLDLNLPKVNGLEVLRHVKSRKPHTVVVILTGHASDHTAVRALKMGADDYLSKPVRHAQLAAALEKGLDRSRREHRGEPDGLPRTAGREPELASLFLEAPTALLHTDAAGVVRSANDAAGRLLGRRVDDLTGRPVEELLDPSIRATWLEAVGREVSDGNAYEGEVFLMGSGRDPIPAALTARGRRDGGLVFSVRDLTHQKALEKQFFESKKLASLGRVVEGVAHEVRNPIIAIGGFARKLVRELPPDGERARYLNVILAEVQRLEKMVREIEDYVDLTTHRRPCFSPVDVGAVLAEKLGSARPRCDCQSVSVDWTRPLGLPCMFGDPALLGELFEGLVENACDAMAGGGRLHAVVECTGNWLRIHLSDTGVGIPESDLGEIFNPFVTSKTSGAGLGLAKAYMIVEEHSGMIEFESEVGKGTVCTVSLPVDRRRLPREHR